MRDPIVSVAGKFSRVEAILNRSQNLQNDGEPPHLGHNAATMSQEKEPEDRRREKENMDEPQEEFIDISSVPSHTKEEEKRKRPRKHRPTRGRDMARY